MYLINTLKLDTVILNYWSIQDLEKFTSYYAKKTQDLQKQIKDSSKEGRIVKEAVKI